MNQSIHYFPQIVQKMLYLFSVAQSILSITCSKLTIETLEQDVKYVQSLQ